MTGLACASGRQFRDWSADYRLFERERVDEQALFAVAQCQVESYLSPGAPLIVAMDDSILRKTGKTVHGAGWRRDPLSPPFHVNFAWGQRVLQISAALPGAPGQARMIPIDFQHTPPAPKLPRNASPQDRQRHARLAKQRQLNAQAVARVTQLRQTTAPDRPLWVLVDGRFTNRTVLKAKPPNTVFIGRIRKDAKLYEPPVQQPDGASRRRLYGQPLPTPEQIRLDPQIPWQTVRTFACGKWQDFRIKTCAAVRWRAAGGQSLRLVIIAPLGYRKTKNGKTYYRQPAYLICTDPDIALEDLIQAYVWRWDIEVNFRDEKTLLGLGQAQVRTPAAAQKLPAAAVAAYSWLLLAAASAYGPHARPDQLPAPKWRVRKPHGRATTADLINHLRAELWGRAIDPDNFSGFSQKNQHNQKPIQCPFNPQSAVMYATG